MSQKFRNLSFFLIIISLVSFIFQTTTLAQKDNDPISIGTYRILHSKILNEDSTLLISLPRKSNES